MKITDYKTEMQIMWKWLLYFLSLHRKLDSNWLACNSFYSRYFKFFFMTRWVLHGSSSPSCVSLYHSRMAKQLVISCSCPICLNQHCRHCLLYQHCRSPHCQPCQPLNHHCLSLHCLHFPACQQCLLSPRSPCLHFQACLQSPPSQQQSPPSPSSPHLPEIRPMLVFLFCMFDYSAYCIDLYEVVWGIHLFLSVFSLSFTRGLLLFPNFPVLVCVIASCTIASSQ